MANIDDKYIALQKWMVTQLELSGNELIIYGYIYSFQFKSFWGKETPDKVTPTEIPISDFIAWTGLTKRGVIYILKSLQDRELIKIAKAPGHLNSYEVTPDPIIKARKGEYHSGEKIAPPESSSGEAHFTGEKIAPVKKLHQGGEKTDTTSGEKIAPVVVKCTAQSGEKIAPHSIRNTSNTQKNTRIQNAQTRDDASASLSSTDTEDRYEDLSKSEIAFFEKQALKKLNETDETTGQKLYLTKDPRDQFPKAFLFMTAKDTSQFTDTEFELFKMVSMYTAFGPAKPLPTVSEEDAKYVPPASEIGQEAHDAQQTLVDWVFEGGPSPSSYAHDAPLQSRRQK